MYREQKRNSTNNSVSSNLLDWHNTDHKHIENQQQQLSLQQTYTMS